MYKRLAQLITEDKVIKARCPRCSGRVTLPIEVQYVERGNFSRYEPQGLCHNCGVGWGWRSEKNPVGGTAIHREDRGKTNVWFCDRELKAPAPTIMEE